jgi:protocatechuate 3,4-dioxygenase beta subunit
MDNDDKPVGTVLSRRSALRLLGSAALGVGLLGGSRSSAQPSASGASLLRGSAMARNLSCVVRPALTEGPFFVDEKLNRSDLRTDSKTGAVKPGVPLALTFWISQVAPNLCKPLGGVLVDLWHCDALGAYSDVGADGTVGQDFLRGYQVTAKDGTAKFTTIYPGWYPGRTVHIHFKLRFQGREFTSQLFFPEEVTDRVHATQPYASKGRRNVRNASDGIYQSGGSQLLLNLSGDPGKGYAAAFDIGMNLG